MTQLFIPVNPKRLTGPETVEACDHIVHLTREGSVQEWVERIAGIARRANVVPLGEICWQGAPERVALSLVDAHNRKGQVLVLVTIIQKMLAEERS